MIKSIKLASGSEMPVLGLGTAKATRESLENAVSYAVHCGYRHFDCAWIYGNEDIVGRVLKDEMEDHGLRREDFFISSKIWYTYNTKKKIETCLNDTLKELQVDYLDLYILQWPMTFKEEAEPSHPYTPFTEDVDYVAFYKILEQFVKEGKVKNLGLSNFNVEQLQDILNICEVKPVTNQIEVHPYMQNETIVEFCKKNGIVVSCYGSLGAGQKSKIPDMPKLLENQLLIDIGKKHHKSSAQVCLRWAVQRGLVVLPKSVTPDRILENFQIFDFELTTEEMSDIRNINKKLSLYSYDLFQRQFAKPVKTIE